MKIFASNPYSEGTAFISSEGFKGMGILSPEVTGIEQKAIQAFQVDVWEEGQKPIPHLVVNAHYPEMDRPLCEQLGTRLREHLGDIIVSFTVSIEPGNAVFFIPLKQQNQCSLKLVASAITVIERSYWFDLSQQIRVMCETTGERIEVKLPIYEDGQFEIEV